MNEETDPFVKAISLLDELSKIKKEEDVAEIKQAIINIIKDGKYNVKRTEYNKKIGTEFKIRQEPFEITHSDLFKLISMMRIDPRLHKKNSYVLKNVLKQMIRDNVIKRDLKIETLKHGITVVVQTLKVKE